MDIQKIKELIIILESSSINEIEIKENKTSIRINKYESYKTKTSKLNNEINNESIKKYNSELENRKNEYDKQDCTKNKKELKNINSPMVGTFYKAPSPGATPFVKEGQNIKKGDTLCIIEAMKIQNLIESEVDGKINKILIKNESPVEFNQKMFLIE